MAVEEHKQNDETAITRGREGGVKAVRNKDIGGVMSLYAPEVVSFDIVVLATWSICSKNQEENSLTRIRSSCVW